MQTIRNLTPTRRVARALLGMAAASLLTSGAHAAAVVTGSAMFNTTTNDYTYSYSVMNSGPMDDLVLVSIPAFSPLGVSSIFAPSGFSLTYDMSQNWVNLIEDGSILTSETFAPGSTVSGFSFNSATAPGFVNFLAYDASGTEFTGSVVAPVPEPSGALLAVLAGAGATLRRRRATPAI